MSISNILQPNDYGIYCESLTPSYVFNPSRMTSRLTYLQTSQLVADSEPTVALYDSEEPAPNDMPPLPYVFENGVFTALRTCLINLVAQVKWQANDDGSRTVGIRKNLDTHGQSINFLPANIINIPPSFNSQSVSWTSILQKDEFFSVELIQNSGITLNVEGILDSPNFYTTISITSIY